MTILLLLVGAAAGLLGSLAGVGGGILLVPALTLLFGVPFPVAVATSLVGVIATSTGSSARYLADGLCDIRLGMVLEVATVFGAIVGGWSAAMLPVGALQVLFALFALYLAGWQWIAARRAPAETPDVLRATEGSWRPRNLPAGVAVSSVAGFVSAVLGIGGGALKVPVMNMVMGVPFRIAVATSAYMIGVTASASALLYLRRGLVDLAIAAPTVVGVLAGATVGTRWMPRVPVTWLRLLFATILVVIAARMLVEAIA